MRPGGDAAGLLPTFNDGMSDSETKRLIPPSIDLEQWHEASAIFTTAAQRFCELSVSLETQCTIVNRSSPDLVARVETVIGFMQTALNGQLVRARAALTKVRNKLSGCSIFHLPDEILADIFIRHVYSLGEYHGMDTMDCRVNYIYQRVHTLLGVCVTWRRVGIACQDLWTVVPLADDFAALRYRSLSTQLSLQRASHKSLHLAISTHHFSPKRLELLAGHWHRFSVVNIWSDSLSREGILNYLLPISQNCPPGSLSKLSIRKKSWGWDSEIPRHEKLIDLDTRIYRLIGSLSVFRINGLGLPWGHISFSHRLVELRIADILLQNDSKIVSLFTALSSAPELKVLKLISVVSFYTGEFSITPPDVVSLLKLELLHLERLYFNVLKLILSYIARGSYHLTLNLNEETYQEYPDDEEEEPVSAKRLNALLKTAAIDKLILSGYYEHFPWTSPTGLQDVLRSVPGLKTLVLNHYSITPQLLTSLQPPPNSNFPAQNDVFPQLTRLEIHGASFAVPLADLKPGFEAVFHSHQIQTMVLGGTFRPEPSADDGEPLDENDDVVEWMRRNVPRFHFSRDSRVSRPEGVYEWRLWDI
ncbi:unnamed protein product [Rhizoctonia solani]|uniref:Uncharacterized protein n=1 Tax=Rhizoctonia solani TaxID=456999 RepID=A0A8H3E6D9_9AGAM|nr:unnamed protein product [Rhizoctonia solani]